MLERPDFRRPPYRHEREKRRKALLERYGALVAASESMPPEERRRLEAWESEFVTGDSEFGTLDWPGWGRHVGPPPSKTSKQ